MPPHPPEGRIPTPEVMAVDYSADGKYVAAGMRDTTVRIVEVQTAAIRELRGHEKGVRSVAFNQDATLIASSGHDEAIRVWDTKTGQERAVLRVPPLVTTDSLQFSDDSRYLVTGSYDGLTRLWDLSSNTLVRSTQGGPVIYVAFLDHDRRILTVGSDGTIVVTGMDGNEYWLAKLETRGLTAGVLSPDQQVLVVGDSAGHVLLVDSESGRLLADKPVRHDDVNSISGLAFTRSGQTVAAVVWGHTVEFLDAKTGETVGELNMESGPE